MFSLHVQVIGLLLGFWSKHQDTIMVAVTNELHFNADQKLFGQLTDTKIMDQIRNKDVDSSDWEREDSDEEHVVLTTSATIVKNKNKTICWSTK